MRDLILSVKRGTFRSDDPSADEANAEFKKVRKVILERDNYTCQFCGFRSGKFQEVHHVDDNHANNAESNLVTTCCLCHACSHIGLSGVKQRGIIIYIPPSLNVTQAKLNQLVRTLWICELTSKDVNIRSQASMILENLSKKNVDAKRRMGTSDPTVLGDFLLNLPIKDYERRGEALSGFYLLPLIKPFNSQLKFWASSVYNNTPSDEWSEISKQKLINWCENEFNASGSYEMQKMLNGE